MAKHATSLTLSLVTLFLVSSSSLAAQSDTPLLKKPLLVSLFNAGTQFPGSGILGVFTTPVHPGLSAGTEFRYNHHPKNQFFQTAKVAVSYHKYVQTSVQLYSETGYRRIIWRGFQAEFRLGAGYLHALAATQVFEAKNGIYRKKTNLGRPQFMASSALGLGYEFTKGENPLRVFLDYQFYLQMPFVKSYVPLAPNTALHLGVAVPFFN
jgi:hypothetical protein